MNNECIFMQTLKNTVVKNARKSIVLIPKSRYADGARGACVEYGFSLEHSSDGPDAKRFASVNTP
jgi:hypothetical protein